MPVATLRYSATDGCHSLLVSYAKSLGMAAELSEAQGAYAELRRTVVSAGLLERAYGYYLWRTALSFLVLAVGIALPFILVPSAHTLVVSALVIAFGSIQVALIGHDPLGIREIPELLRYHHRIRQGDRADWVWGILFSDVIAKHFYRAFGSNQTQQDPLFGNLSTRILQDESRHLAFAEHYLKRNVLKMEPARRRALIVRLPR